MYTYTKHRLSLRNFKTREQARKTLIQSFLNEKAGTGRKELASRHLYFVETLKDGRRIYLKRPASLNKGFDFEIWVKNWAQGRDGRPSHKLILRDLRRKCKKNSRKYISLKRAIDGVYRCQEPDKLVHKFRRLRFKTGIGVELLLKVLKWMFIEQDMTYWNWSGRAMLKAEIDKIPN